MVTGEHISQIVLDCLLEGRIVEIDGLGVFKRGANGNFRFEPQTALRVFLAYVDEDAGRVTELYEALENSGFAPWMDKKRLLAGQNWPRAIEKAIRTADVFVPCYSRRALDKKGRFQAEVRFALKCSDLEPMEATFVMPVRLEECTVPAMIADSIQFIDLFPGAQEGVQQLVKALWAARRTLS